VISATAPNRCRLPDPAKAAAREWIIGNQDRLYVPVTAVTEVAAGIGTREASGATRHAANLAAWLRAIFGDYPDRVLALDTAAALHARGLARTAWEAGVTVGFADLTVACIARAHRLVIATRNLRDFAPMGIETLDPFAA
jgi:predicted nucleic acid-binding protein